MSMKAERRAQNSEVEWQLPPALGVDRCGELPPYSVERN